MVDVKQAVASARAFAAETLEIDGGDLLLEELGSDPSAFNVTLSFPERGRDQRYRNPLLADMRANAREYKQFAVDRESGRVTGMQMRQF